MKKLVVTILSISVLGLYGTATANGAQGTRVASAQTQTTSHATLAAETVNDIAIPMDVLLYVQTEYQGFAVTQASKANHSNQQIYRLRVDRSDSANDYDGFYLLYDMNWKLLGEEKIAQPTQIMSSKPKSEKPEASPQPRTEVQDEPEKPNTTTNSNTPSPSPVSTENNQPTTGQSDPAATTGDSTGTTTEQSEPPTTTGDGTTTGN